MVASVAIQGCVLKRISYASCAGRLPDEWLLTQAQQRCLLTSGHQ
jgi:hypothetical protein